MTCYGIDKSFEAPEDMFTGRLDICLPIGCLIVDWRRRLIPFPESRMTFILES